MSAKCSPEECAAAYTRMRERCPCLPESGPEGQAFVSYTVNVENQVSASQDLFGPAKPRREWKVCDWEEDEDGEEYPVNERTMTLTEEEFDAAMVRYEAALAEWKRTNGARHEVTGPPIVTASFECADGSTCSGMGQLDQWRWTSWTTGGK